LYAYQYKLIFFTAYTVTFISIQALYLAVDVSMGRITLTLRDDLDKRLRQTVFETLGFKKGNLQLAIEEAIEAWINDKVRQMKAKR